MKIIRTEQSKVDWYVIGVGGFDLDRVLAFEPSSTTSAEHQHDDSISSVSVKFEGELMVKERATGSAS